MPLLKKTKRYDGDRVFSLPVSQLRANPAQPRTHLPLLVLVRWRWLSGSSGHTDLAARRWPPALSVGAPESVRAIPASL